MEFPTLFGEATNGKAKQWSIRVVRGENGEGIMETVYGYEGGKLQTQQKVIATGKNLGKKNATTALEQAVLEARALWTKKRESGYAARYQRDTVQEREEDEEEHDEKKEKGRGKGVSEDAISPMLAHDYHKRGKSIRFPCYVQPKLDGTRAVGMVGKGLFSRNRKAYAHLEHIRAELNQLPPGLILDGELYSTELTFQEIVGLVKKETLTPADEPKQRQIQYHIYDVVNDRMYEERLELLRSLFHKADFRYLVLVPTEICPTQEAMKEKHADFVAEGYEGIMLRNVRGMYVFNRSIDLQKYKEFVDDEYEVVGFEEGQGLEQGCVIWVCATPDGQTFSCRPRGSREDRQEQFQTGASYVGKKLTVRFQELTDDGKPRFPVGIAFRDYE